MEDENQFLKILLQKIFRHFQPQGHLDPTWRYCPGLGHWGWNLFGFPGRPADSAYRITLHIVKQTRNSSGSQSWSIFFFVLSYEIYFSLNSYSTKHASQKGSHRPESEDAVYGLKLIKLSIYINHPESVKTTGFHIRVIYTRFTTLIQFIKSCKNNQKTLFSSECTQRRQSRAQLPAIQTDSCWAALNPQTLRPCLTPSPNLSQPLHGMVKHKITAVTIAGGQPSPCTDAVCRSSS